MRFHPGVGFAHWRHAQIEQAWRRSAQQHNLVFEQPRSNAPRQHIRSRNVLVRPSSHTPWTPKWHQDRDALVHGHCHGAVSLRQSNAL